MSETTTLLKVGTAELVLRLIEAGVPMRDFTLENPIRAIRGEPGSTPNLVGYPRWNSRRSTTRRSRNSSGATAPPT